MVTSAHILPLLEKAIGTGVDLVSEAVQADGQVLVTWRRRLAPDDMRFGEDPGLLISADGNLLRWASDPPEQTFTLEDLAAADPADEANRHPRTKELARRLESDVRAANLMSPSGAAALAIALTDRRVRPRGLQMHPESAAGLVATATGQGFWDILAHIYLSWRYLARSGDMMLPAPYTQDEESAARRIVSEKWFEKALLESGSIEAGDLYLPIVANERAALH